MAGRSISARNRELAYRVWCEQGQNMDATHRELSGVHDLSVSKPTLYDWKKKGGWEERAARAEAQERKAGEASEEAQLIQALDTQRQRYERYFDAQPENKQPDNQAIYAYTGLVKTISEVKAKHAQYRAEMFTDFMRDLIRWAGQNSPPTLATLEEIFDDFTAFVREKYAG